VSNSTTGGIYANKRQLLKLARAVLEYVNNGGDRPIMPDTFGIARRANKATFKRNYGIRLAGIASIYPREPSRWARAFAKFDTFLDTGIPASTIFTDGNGKLPFKAFSALPLITCPGAGPCLEWCYSFKAWRFPDAYFRQLQNTVLLATAHGRAHIRREFCDIPRGVDLRLYVDGDMDSASTMGFWWELLNSRPDIPTYGYSKSWQLFLDWYDAGREFPSNYLLNASSGSKYDAALLARIKTLPVYRGTFDALPVSHKMPDRRIDAKAFNVWASELRATARTMGMGKVWACPGKCGDCTPTGHACGSRKFQNIPVVIGLH
jgi:hypothetical protein